MKTSWFLFLLLSISLASMGQVKIVGVQAIFGTDREGRGILSNAREIKGSPFASTGWNEGTIVFSNGLKGTNTQLNFDLYSNKPAFREEGSLFHFKDPVKEIRYQEERNGQSEKLLFRNEYPAVGYQDRSFYYLVREDGDNYHLLQLVEKTVKEEMVSIGVYDKRFEEQRDWYLFDVKADKLVKIPKGKKEFGNLSKVLSPSFSTYLLNNKDVNMKSETDLIKMVKALNQ